MIIEWKPADVEHPGNQNTQMFHGLSITGIMEKLEGIHQTAGQDLVSTILITHDNHTFNIGKEFVADLQGNVRLATIK